MKKCRSFLVVMLALAMVMSLAACGGKKEKPKETKAEVSEDTDNTENEEVVKNEYEFFKCVVPESFKETKEIGVFLIGEKGKIKCYENSRTAEEEFQDSFTYWETNKPGEHKDGGTAEIGLYTWRVEKFPWNTKVMSSTLYADKINSEYGSIEINLFDVDLEDPDVQTFLESFEDLPIE